MHRSRLAGVIIDCQVQDLDAAARFWSQALGVRLHDNPPEETPYRGMDDLPGGLYTAVQKVDHPSRVHLDIETDDLEAEVRRLEALGAKRIGPVKRWIVMEAPTGQRFCVVPAESKDFATSAKRWD